MSSERDFPDFAEDKNYMLSGGTLNKLIRAIRQNRVLNSPDVSVQEKPNGLILKINGGRGPTSESDYPFKIRQVTGGITIQPGTVANMIMPTIGLVPLTSAPVLSISSTGTVYVLFKINIEYVTNSHSTLVLGGNVTSVEIIATTTVPAPAFASGEGYDYLWHATFQDGELIVGEYLRKSLSVAICDSGLGDGMPKIIVGGAY